ncbi:MAG: SGNH/GDSL hydrolase family protein [Hyphomicrobium sp.]
MTTRPSAHSEALIALPFVLFLYPAIALIATRSEIPVFLGMYSRDMLVLITLILICYLGIVAAFWLNWRHLQFAAILLLVLLTLVATNNAVRDLPALEPATQLARFTGGLSLILVTFFSDKRRVSTWTGIGLGIGAVVVVSALIDFCYSSAAWLLPSDRQGYIDGKYRTAMDLSKVTEDDVVLVGDSFVWGAGVPVEQRFGNLLERKFGSGQGPRVYSLGVVGVGVGEYNRQLLDVPAAKRVRNVIVFFYANDMPPRASLRQSIEKVSVVIGQRSLTGRALLDLVRFMITPSADAYAQEVLEGFVRDDATFAFRWSLLEDSLKTLHQRATERSRERPILVILPMLVDFGAGAFDEPHRRVAELAERIGFRALDVTPAFRSLGQNAEHFRAAKNDLHLNERGNAIVADVLMTLVTTGPASAKP